MLSTHFTINISVRTTPLRAFQAIQQELSKWWGKVDSIAKTPGDEFSVIFGETEWRFKLIESHSPILLIWNCIMAHHIVDGMEDIQEEWLDTRLIWTIQKQGDLVNISMKHEGLSSNLNCYDICQAGWTYFIGSSLKSYLKTGKGSPRIQ